MRAGLFAADALARGASARPLSSHTRATLLLVDESACVALLPPTEPLHPWAVVLDALPRPAEACGSVSLGDGTLRVGEWCLDLTTCPPADLSIRARPRAIPSLSLGEPPFASDDPSSTAIERSLAAFVASGEPLPLAALVGMGPGLTPSGDDVLIGLLAGLDSARDACRAAATLRAEVIAALLAAPERQTTRLSAQLLRAAASGQYPEPLVTLAEALAADPASPAALSESLEALRRVGSHSGEAMLQGFAAALARCR